MGRCEGTCFDISILVLEKYQVPAEGGTCVRYCLFKIFHVFRGRRYVSMHLFVNVVSFICAYERLIWK